MSLFARASWPGDHRDEIVAGTLVAAVIVVLGYASGIGAPAPATVDTAAPPAVGAPSESSEPGEGVSDGSGDGDSGPALSDPGAGSAGGSWTGGGAAGIPVVVGTPPAAGRDGHGAGGEGAGHGPAPVPSAPATGSPAPIPSGSCDEGEVRLVQPLLTGTLTQVTGLLDGLTGVATAPSQSASPSPSSSPDGLCVGVAASPSVAAGVLP